MISETIEFEQLYKRELDRIYRELGYQIVQRVYGRKNEDYDLILMKNGKEKKIEEKGLNYYFPDCPIELIQNIYPLDLGWFYKTKADYIHFLYYDKETGMPFILYQLTFSRLKENLNNFFKEDGWRMKIMPRFSIINYGITLNLCIRWDYLIRKGCVYILKKWKEGFYASQTR
jgi:hypothetical protein